MYEIICEECGQIGFHPSRVGAESRAQSHQKRNDHSCSVTEMTEVEGT